MDETPPPTMDLALQVEKHLNKHRVECCVCLNLSVVLCVNFVCVCVCSDGIYQYMKKQTGPDSVHLKTEEDLQTFINNYDASIFGTLILPFIQFVPPHYFLCIPLLTKPEHVVHVSKVGTPQRLNPTTSEKQNVSYVLSV